jgi:hypothetical protein
MRIKTPPVFSSQYDNNLASSVPLFLWLTPILPKYTLSGTPAVFFISLNEGYEEGLYCFFNIFYIW